MRHRFLHAADLHLGSPLKGLRGLGPETAGRFEAAPRRAFAGLVDRALAGQVAYGVVAGDMFDGPWRDVSTGVFYVAQLARLSRAGIPAFTLRGNHDAESIVTRSLRLPDGIHEFPTGAPRTLRVPGLPVALHGQGFATREVTGDLAAAYPAPVPGVFNIGVLHTSLDGREGHAPYAPTTAARLAAKGYDYWALGHVHAHEIVSTAPHVVFPGVLQGRHVGETGAKGAVLVTVDEALRVESVERVIVDVARFAVATIDLSGEESEEAAWARVERALGAEVAAAGDRLLAVRVVLGGETALHARFAADRSWLAAEVAAAAARAGHDVHVEDVKLATRPPGRLARPRSEPGEDLVDAERLIAEALADPETAAALGQALKAIRLKLPATAAEDAGLATDADLAALLREGADLALGRLAGATP